MSHRQQNKLDQQRVSFNDELEIAYYETDTESHNYSYAQLEWESSFLKHQPGPLTEVLRTYQQRKRKGEL